MVFSRFLDKVISVSRIHQHLGLLNPFGGEPTPMLDNPNNEVNLMINHAQFHQGCINLGWLIDWFRIAFTTFKKKKHEQCQKPIGLVSILGFYYSKTDHEIIHDWNS